MRASKTFFLDYFQQVLASSEGLECSPLDLHGSLCYCLRPVSTTPAGVLV